MLNPTLLTQKALNRALLERQLLLRRSKLSPAKALAHLVGMQAQVPTSPYVGLWTRLAGFRPDQLSLLIRNRRAVRIVVMRSTLHLVTSEDCLTLWPVLQAMLRRRLQHSEFGRNVVGLNSETLVAAGRIMMEERPRTHGDLSKLLTEHWPDRDGSSLAFALRTLLASIQPPPRGIWGEGGQATWTPAENWLGRSVSSETSPNKMILRYLAAFGPASVSDIQAWSGLNALREVVEELRPSLRTFHDEGDRELFDVRAAPLGDPETPAPVRFLPEFDNALLGHADRTRIIPREYKTPMVIGKPAVLVDGFVRGIWKIARHRGAATLTITLWERPSRKDGTALRLEGAQLLAFAAADAADRKIEITVSG